MKKSLKHLLPSLSGITFFSFVCTCFSFSLSKSATADLSGSLSGRRASDSAVRERDCLDGKTLETESIGVLMGAGLYSRHLCYRRFIFQGPML